MGKCSSSMILLMVLLNSTEKSFSYKGFIWINGVGKVEFEGGANDWIGLVGRMAITVVVCVFNDSHFYFFTFLYSTIT